ncbi:MAG: molybdopterin-dependent oxidoreductase [Clostridiales Family XIII bacterium]|jgi:trimethylamine-N-oxide reductase (cytochrome c)|nr:molybdopterin-dependent oxidoreductase [Clostridiales Family XIII bacterium]
MVQKIDARADRTVLKGASLMGPQSGPPTAVDSGKDGKITRIRPFYYDKDFEWEDLNPWKIEAKGSTFEPPNHTLPGTYFLSYKKRVYSENRVRYPLKRVDWDPKGERNTQNRGKSKYKRISWEEASRLIADELLRVKAKYGMSAVLAEADMHGEGKHIAPCHGCMNKLLSMLGGYTVQMRNMDSWEGYSWGAKNVWGGEPVGQMQPSGNIWPDIAKNAEQLLLWGADPETTPVGFDGYMASRLSQWIHNLGHKYVYVDPALNWSGAYLADKWIPVMPNTDAALLLAIIYVWLEEGLWDSEYVETHAVGYEAFFEYVRGNAEDGTPKTPRWASEKCGVPPWTIKALARQWHGKVTSFTIGNGGPGIRGPFATEPARLQAIAMGMQGLGKPGRHHAKWLEWNIHSPIYPMPHQGSEHFEIPHRCEILRPVGSDVDLYTGNMPKVAYENEELMDVLRPHPNKTLQAIPKCLLHDAILDGKTDWWGLHSFVGPAEEQWVHYEYPNKGCSNIHMIWTDSPCMVTCWNDGFRIAKAFRDPSIECIVAQQPWLENDCLLADIILPVQTKFELEDICEDTNGGIVCSVYHEYPACPPVGESLDDFDCVAEVARALGPEYYNEYTKGEKDRSRIIELFYEGSVAHLDTNDDFHNKGIYPIPCNPDKQDFKKYPPGLSPFWRDPENNPLSTPTGKLEFTSSKIAELFPGDRERPPYPQWVEKSDLHDERAHGARAKDYPLLCVSNHGRWRFHANLDDITWHREVDTMKMRGADGYQYEAAWINPRTAASRAIAHGDLIKIYNERGTVLCAAYLTERLAEGIVYVDHGARYDPIDPETLDRGGAINLITPAAITSKNVTGMVVSGFLVEAAKVADTEYEGWKKQYPDAFARKVDEGCGLCLAGWSEA